MKYYTVLLVNAFFAVALAQKAFNSQKQQQQYQQQPQQQQQYQQQPQQQQQQKQVVVESKYRNIPIVQLENTQDHDGSFKYSFEDGEGTKVQQNGQLKYVNQESAGEAVQGGYSYTVSDTIVWYEIRFHIVIAFSGRRWQGLLPLVHRWRKRIPPSRWLPPNSPTRPRSHRPCRRVLEELATT